MVVAGAYSGGRADIAARRLRADFVAKVGFEVVLTASADF
jgi:Cys-tRNA synthase (O-phospho-L-seryl-tRNA:Cys-tRNA synthase)